MNRAKTGERACSDLSQPTTGQEIAQKTCYNIFLENPAKWYEGGPELYFTFKYMLNVGKPQGEVLPDSFPSSPTPTHHNPAL